MMNYHEEFIAEQVRTSLSNALVAVVPVTVELIFAFAKETLACLVAKGVIGHYRTGRNEIRPIDPEHDFQVKLHEHADTLHFRWYDAAGNPHISYTSILRLKTS